MPDGDTDGQTGRAASDQATLALDAWTEPPQRPPGPAVPVLATEGFEGPLDWLLDLARSRRIDLARLSIAELITAFEAALTTALGTGDKSPLLLARWGDWLVMATELTLLRSRLLLPTDAADAAAAREAAERLRQTLLSRVETAQAADWLEARCQVGREVFLRGTDEGGTLDRKRTGDITALLRACLVALRLPAEAAALYRVPGPPVWSVLDALARLQDRLPTSRPRAHRSRASCPRSRKMRRTANGGAAPPCRRPSWQGSNSHGMALRCWHKTSFGRPSKCAHPKTPKPCKSDQCQKGTVRPCHAWHGVGSR